MTELLTTNHYSKVDDDLDFSIIGHHVVITHHQRFATAKQKEARS